MQQTISIKSHRRIKGRSFVTRRIARLTKTPMKKSEIVIEISKNEVEKILRDIHKTPKRPVPDESSHLSSEKKRRKNQLENLQSNLSPKYIGLSPGDGKRSRYGRQQRYKEPEDFLPTNIACYVRRTPSKLKTITSPGRIFEQKFVSYESPIEKLINKNKFLATVLTSPPGAGKDSENLLSNTNINETEEAVAEENSLFQSAYINESILSTVSPISSSLEANSPNTPLNKNVSLPMSPVNNEKLVISNSVENSNLDKNKVEETADLDLKSDVNPDGKNKELCSNNLKDSDTMVKDDFEDVLSLNFPKLTKGSSKTSNALSLKSPKHKLESKGAAKTPNKESNLKLKEKPSAYAIQRKNKGSAKLFDPENNTKLNKTPKKTIALDLQDEKSPKTSKEPDQLNQKEKTPRKISPHCCEQTKEETITNPNIQSVSKLGKKTPKKSNKKTLEVISRNAIEKEIKSPAKKNHQNNEKVGGKTPKKSPQNSLEETSEKSITSSDNQNILKQNVEIVKEVSDHTSAVSPRSMKAADKMNPNTTNNVQPNILKKSSPELINNRRDLSKLKLGKDPDNKLEIKKSKDNVTNLKLDEKFYVSNRQSHKKVSESIDQDEPITNKCLVDMSFQGSKQSGANPLGGSSELGSDKMEVTSSVDLVDHMSTVKGTETIAAFDMVDHHEKKLKLSESDISLRLMNKSPSANSTDSAKGSSIDLDIESPVIAGSVFWGRISTFPFWPCIVWPDPEGRTVSIIGKNQLKIHVRFFADNGRRSWVRKNDMLPYSGREEFNIRSQQILSQCNKRHSNYKAYFISDRKKDLWERAIVEADVVLTEPFEKRTSKFNEILDNTRKQLLVEKRKKRVSLNESRVSLKYYSGLSEDTCSLFSETNEYSSSMKRDRSPTPESPAYEDIDDLKLFVKRRKLDLNVDQSVSKSKSYEELSSLSSIEIDYNLEDDEFKGFYDLMKTYAMCYNNEAMEKQLYESVKQIWIIRSMARKELKDTSLSSVFSTSEMNIRRLSSRMRTLSKKENLLNGDVSIGQKVDKRGTFKRPSKPIEEVVVDIMELQKNYLFKGLNREPVCKICYKPSNLSKCSGSCQSWIHLACIHLSSSTSAKMLHVTGDLEEVIKDELSVNNGLNVGVLCKDCRSGEEQKCFVCKNNDPNLGERIKCYWNSCGKVFHLSCLKYWPQSKLTKSSAKIESLLCPCHVCHTCVSDDPRGKFLQIDKCKLAKCIQCPATYHLDSFCIPAGTQFLTATALLCPRHKNEKKLQNVNANWCFICATGGSLICCETCPTSFHLECLKISQPEGNYICEECETGRLPLYGEMVWAKLGVYRWWPAIIIPPPEVPKNLTHKPHNNSDFCVRFFGSNDHTWISRNRVFLYQEGDWGHVNQAKGIDQAYKNGLEEAKRIFALIKEKKLSQNSEDRDKRLTPLPYVKIKANRPVPPVKLQEVDISELTACDCNPSDINPCGSNSGCLNRLLLTECNPKVCPAGSKCQNQMFEKRLYPSLKVCRTSGKGWGLVSDEDLVAGDFIIEYVGEVIDDAEFKRRIAQKQEEKDENYYFLTLEKDCMIDAGPKGNLARFMNHSCEPNCETQKWNVNGVTRVGLFAIKDIPPNTELTFNYNLECIGDDKKVCYCGAERCAGFIGAKYKEPERVKTSVKKSKSTRGNTKKSKKRRKVKLPIPNGN